MFLNLLNHALKCKLYIYINITVINKNKKLFGVEWNLNKLGFCIVWSMEIRMSRVRIWITLTSLTIDMYMSREGVDPIKQFNH